MSTTYRLIIMLKHPGVAEEVDKTYKVLNLEQENKSLKISK